MFLKAMYHCCTIAKVEDHSCTMCTDAMMKPMHAFIGTQVFVLSTKCICTYHGSLGILPLNLQGLPVLVGLIEDNVAESGKLTGIGVDCIWRVLEVHGTSPLNHLCRLLANAGLPNRLMRAMLTFNQEYQLLQTHAEVGLHSLLFSSLCFSLLTTYSAVPQLPCAPCMLASSLQQACKT